MEGKMASNTTCVICGQDAFRDMPNTKKGEYLYKCETCGKFWFDSFTLMTFEKGAYKEDRAMISAYTRELFEYNNDPPKFFTPPKGEEIEKIIERYKKKTAFEKLDNLILYLERKSRYFGATLKILSERDYPITYSKNKFEFDKIYEHAKEIGLIKFPSGSDQANTELTWKGLERAEKIKESGSLSKKCFVAMSCSEGLREIYENGIKKAIIEAGYEPVFIEREEHNEKICDLIIAEIRSCKFLIADVTEQRQNVYYEAGFAQGLNRDVIWACREDEIEKVHFDTRQYNHIVWKDAMDLRKKLVNRIKATIL
jgi:nucleoside 2-deoxyribosyltransferase